MPLDHAIVRTRNASRYLQQLCKHWAHRFETRFTPLEGEIALPLGQVSLRAAGDSLGITLNVPNADDRPRMREVVQSHVERFAFREALQFDWKPTETDAPTRGQE